MILCTDVLLLQSPRNAVGQVVLAQPLHTQTELRTITHTCAHLDMLTHTWTC